jgi:hypothetical protein
VHVSVNVDDLQPVTQGKNVENKKIEELQALTDGTN